MKILNKITALALVTFSVLIFFSCSVQTTCLEDYKEFIGYTYSPNISIEDKLINNGNCEFKVRFTLCIGDETYLDEGIMIIRKDKYYLQSSKGMFEEFKIFDLKLNIDEKFNARFKYSINSLDGVMTYAISLIDQAYWNDKKVYIFRVEDSFCESNYQYDQVFFITKENGIIGSYISAIDNDQVEWIYSPRGEILKDILDYSNKEFGKIL